MREKANEKESERERKQTIKKANDKESKRDERIKRK